MLSFSEVFSKYKESYSKLDEYRHLLDSYIWNWFKENRPSDDPEDWFAKCKLLERNNSDILEVTFTNKICDRLSMKILFNEEGGTVDVLFYL